MRIAVVYHSSTGNTQKIAEAMAKALGVSATPVGEGTVSFSEPVDLLLVGDGIYFGKASKGMRAFIDGLSPDSVRSAAVFATYGGQAKITALLQEQLESRGIRVIGEPFCCRGQSWMIMNRNHPSGEELSRAREYAMQVAAEAGL